MDYIWMTARSLTEAQKMKNLLQRHKIPAALERARGAAAESGCGYMVGVKAREKELAKTILRGAGIFPRKIFLSEGGRLWEEIL